MNTLIDALRLVSVLSLFGCPFVLHPWGVPCIGRRILSVRASITRRPADSACRKHAAGLIGAKKVS